VLLGQMELIDAIDVAKNEDPELSETDSQELWALQWLSSPEQTGVPTMRRVWNQHRDELLEEHIASYPGTRPPLWWKYGAPRMALDDMPESWRHCSFAKDLPEPSKRLGGVGTPCCEVFAHVPAFVSGIPHPWVQPWDVRYYTGRAVDIHGNPIGQEFVGRDFKGAAVDPSNPPQYKSQANYLKRHGRFPSGEERRLSLSDFAPDILGPGWWSDRVERG